MLREGGQVRAWGSSVPHTPNTCSGRAGTRDEGQPRRGSCTSCRGLLAAVAVRMHRTEPALPAQERLSSCRSRPKLKCLGVWPDASDSETFLVALTRVRPEIFVSAEARLGVNGLCPGSAEALGHHSLPPQVQRARVRPSNRIVVRSEIAAVVRVVDVRHVRYTLFGQVRPVTGCTALPALFGDDAPVFVVAVGAVTRNSVRLPAPRCAGPPWRVRLVGRGVSDLVGTRPTGPEPTADTAPTRP